MTSESRARMIMRWLFAVFYFAMGVMHLRSPDGFVAITPHWVPAPELVVALTGIAEIAGAIGLITRNWRKAAGIGLALYAVCVFPANVNHAINNLPLGGTTQSWWYHGPRLLFQPVFVWWALWVGGVIDWPFGKRAGAKAGGA